MKLFIQETVNKVKIVDLKLVSPSDSQKCNVGANNISCEAYLNNWHFFPNIFWLGGCVAKAKTTLERKKRIVKEASALDLEQNELSVGLFVGHNGKEESALVFLQERRERRVFFANFQDGLH